MAKGDLSQKVSKEICKIDNLKIRQDLSGASRIISSWRQKLVKIGYNFNIGRYGIKKINPDEIEALKRDVEYLDKIFEKVSNSGYSLENFRQELLNGRIELRMAVKKYEENAFSMANVS